MPRAAAQALALDQPVVPLEEFEDETEPDEGGIDAHGTLLVRRVREACLRMWPACARGREREREERAACAWMCACIVPCESVSTTGRACLQSAFNLAVFGDEAGPGAVVKAGVKRKAEQVRLSRGSGDM